MFKIVTTFLSQTFEASQTVFTRGIKTRGEYFRRIGYKYDNIYKGGNSIFPVLISFSFFFWVILKLKKRV